MTPQRIRMARAHHCTLFVPASAANLAGDPRARVPFSAAWRCMDEIPPGLRILACRHLGSPANFIVDPISKPKVPRL